MIENNIPVQEGPHSEQLITVTKNVSDQNPQHMKLMQVLPLYRHHSEAYTKLIEQIRNEPDKKRRTTLKQSLLCTTVGALMEGGTAEKHIIKHNKYLAIDIDSKDRVTAEIIKDFCIKSFGKNSVLIAISASGNGVHVIIHIADAKRKKETWKAVAQIFKLAGIEIDPATKDETRKLFLSQDNNSFINENAEAFIIPENFTSGNKLVKATQTKTSDPAKTVTDILHFASDKGLKFEEGTRHTYTLFVSSQCSGRGIPMEAALKILDEKINLSAFEDHLHTFHDIYARQAEDFGKFAGKKKMNPVVQVQEALKERYAFRYNVIKGRTEFRKINEETWCMFTDRELNSLLFFLITELNLGIPVEHLQRLIHSNFTPEYNAFTEYFGNLPTWDGVDYIAELAATVKTTDDSFFGRIIKKWLVALVASALVDELSNHTVLTLAGDQGIGKTSWLIKLCPPSLIKYLYSGIIDAKNKDTMVHISECLLINLEELGTQNRTEQNELKEVITKANINVRLPYGRFPEIKIRRASFCGSVNDIQFLTDPTGSRRFLVNEALSINYKHTLDMDKVYAQAYHLFKDGFKYYFTPDEVTMINQQNEQYTQHTVEEEMLLLTCTPGTEERTDQFWAATELAEFLFKDKVRKVDYGMKKRLGQALSKHGYQRVTRQDRKVYRVNLNIKDKPFPTDPTNDPLGFDELLTN